MLVWGRRANTGLLVSENAGWVCGVGWVLQGGLRWPEPGGTFRLVSANSSSTGERTKQEGEQCSQVQTVERGPIAPRRATGGGSPAIVPGD